MSDLTIAVEKFRRAELGFPDFQEVLRHAVRTKPAESDGILEMVDELLLAGALDRGRYTTLRSEIENELATIEHGTNELITAEYTSPASPNKPGPINLLAAAVREPTVWVGAELKNRFVLISPLGRGGMGLVFKALDKRRQHIGGVDPYVAVKLLRDKYHCRPNAMAALQRECLAAQLLSHPNIVNVFDLDSDGERFFMTMEFLRGKSLRELLLGRKAPVPFRRAMSLIRDMAAGLAYAHQNGLVHCDFKPANVFITAEGQVKIFDFGIAKLARTDTRAGGITAATRAYATREMLEGGAVDPRDDIYALACVAYQLLAGKHPYDNRSAVEASQLNLRAERIKSLSRRQWRGLKRGLALERRSRIRSVDELVDALGIAGSNRRALRRARRWALGAGVLALTSLALVLWILYRSAQAIPVLPPSAVPPGSDLGETVPSRD